MKVVVVDDDSAVAQFVGIAARKEGHEAAVCPSASDALDLIDAGTHLLISDVIMRSTDGFDLAQEVADKYGRSIPKTILISGSPHTDRLNLTPPSVVMGLMQKPVSYESVCKVLDLAERTREKCPGCLERWPNDGRFDESDICHGSPETCSQYNTGNYGLCPHYDDTCGLEMRQWIANA